MAHSSKAHHEAYLPGSPAVAVAKHSNPCWRSQDHETPQGGRAGCRRLGGTTPAATIGKPSMVYVGCSGRFAPLQGAFAQHRSMGPRGGAPFLPELTVLDATDGMTVERLAEEGVSVAFSALPSREAKDLEPMWAGAGIAVFSNASAHRRRDGVPLVIPEINAEALRPQDGEPCATPAPPTARCYPGVSAGRHSSRLRA